MKLECDQATLCISIKINIVDIPKDSFFELYLLNLYMLNFMPKV